MNLNQIYLEQHGGYTPPVDYITCKECGHDFRPHNYGDVCHVCTEKRIENVGLFDTMETSLLLH